MRPSSNLDIKYDFFTRKLLLELMFSRNSFIQRNCPLSGLQNNSFSSLYPTGV